MLNQPSSVVDRGPIFWHYPHFSNQFGRPAAAVRSGEYKLVELYESEKLELYNLRTDISEQKDLSKELPDKIRELHALLVKWRAEVKANMPEPNPLISKR